MNLKKLMIASYTRIDLITVSWQPVLSKGLVLYFPQSQLESSSLVIKIFEILVLDVLVSKETVLLGSTE